MFHHSVSLDDFLYSILSEVLEVMFWMFFGYVLEEPFLQRNVRVRCSPKHLEVAGSLWISTQKSIEFGISKWDFSASSFSFFLAPSMPNEHLHSLQSSRVLPRENLGWGKPPNENSVGSDVSHKTHGPSKTSMSWGSSTPPCVFCDAQNRGLRMRHMTPSPRSEATLLLTCQCHQMSFKDHWSGPMPAEFLLDQTFAKGERWKGSRVFEKFRRKDHCRSYLLKCQSLTSLHSWAEAEIRNKLLGKCWDQPNLPY